LAWQVELTEKMAGLEKLVKRMLPAPKGFSTKSVKEELANNTIFLIT
jgi:hypothetical protein